MYSISYFKANNPTAVLEFMKAHPFVVLCGVDKEGKPVATHVPVLMVEKNDRLYLQAHIMRKQDHTIAFENNQQVLAIFLGANSYVSAQLYDQQNTASTWNYSAVHASGVLAFLDDDALYDLLVRLTNHFEGKSDSPSSVKAMSQDYVHNHMKAIVAFEIEVTNLQHVFKLSQNKSESEQSRIITHLSEGDIDQQKLAQQMKHQ